VRGQSFQSSKPAAKKMARPEGFEPPTLCSGGTRSIHLSYGRISEKERRSRLILLCFPSGSKSNQGIRVGPRAASLSVDRYLIASGRASFRVGYWPQLCIIRRGRGSSLASPVFRSVPPFESWEETGYLSRPFFPLRLSIPRPACRFSPHSL
jgi:hypothetical protein